MTYTWPLGDAESQLEFVDLSHSWGLGQPCWPYFEDVKIERLHGMAKSRVLTQKITTVMHSGTHIDAPGHVVEGTPLLDEIPLSAFFGTGVVFSVMLSWPGSTSTPCSSPTCWAMIWKAGWPRAS